MAAIGRNTAAALINPSYSPGGVNVHLDRFIRAVD